MRCEWEKSRRRAKEEKRFNCSHLVHCRDPENTIQRVSIHLLTSSWKWFSDIFYYEFRFHNMTLDSIISLRRWKIDSDSSTTIVERFFDGTRQRNRNILSFPNWIFSEFIGNWKGCDGLSCEKFWMLNILDLCWGICTRLRHKLIIIFFKCVIILAVISLWFHSPATPKLSMP